MNLIASVKRSGSVDLCADVISLYHCMRGRARIALPLDKLSKAVAADTWCWNSSVESAALLGTWANIQNSDQTCSS
jgi:hypothetical protein